MPNKYTIILNEQEQHLMEKLLSMGYRRQEIFRLGLRTVFHKEFPPYNKAKQKRNVLDDYTNAEYCVKFRNGTVEGRYCVCKDSQGQTQRIPLNRIKIVG